MKKVPKWTDRELVFRALVEAYENVTGLIDAYGSDKTNPVVQEREALLKEFDKYAKRRYRRSVKSFFNEPYEGLIAMPVELLTSIGKQDFVPPAKQEMPK